MQKEHQILIYWFGNLDKDSPPEKDQFKLWFSKNEQTDQDIREKFEETLSDAAKGIYDSWYEDSVKAMALTILFDQFSRNIYRDRAEAFKFDSQARNLAHYAIDKEYDKDFYYTKRFFFYMPLEHSEDLDDQILCVQLFEKMLIDCPENIKESMLSFKNYADKHYEIIKRFGRFPHRNKILGRESTPEEIEFLKEPGSSF